MSRSTPTGTARANVKRGDTLECRLSVSLPEEVAALVDPNPGNHLFYEFNSAKSADLQKILS